MLLIVGLGNPGSQYQNNRHNVGHLFIDYLIKQLRITNSGLKLYKTDCYMNQSGKFVKKIIRNSSSAIDQLIIVHDDLDIPLGKFKIQKGTGPLLHNGIESIEKALRTKDFLRVRIGIDNRLPRRNESEGGTQTNWVDGESYVLQNFRPEEKKIIADIFPKIYHRLKTDLEIL